MPGPKVGFIDFGRVSAIGERDRDRAMDLVSALVDADEVPELGESIPHRGDARGELALVHHGHQVGVVEEVLELLLDVAVVDVDGNRAELVAGEHGFDVLGAVVGVDADVVPRLHTAAGEVVSGAVGALVERGEGVMRLPRHQRFLLRELIIIQKLVTAYDAVGILRKGISIFGGHGVIEDFCSLARIFRDAVVNE